MIITATKHSTVQLILDHDQTGMQLEMTYDDQLEKFQLAILGPKANADVEPLEPVERRIGERDQAYFDRACCIAYRQMVHKVSDLVEEHSRYDRQQYILGEILEKLNHMDLCIAHNSNDKPSESNLHDLMKLLSCAATLDGELSNLCDEQC